MPNEMTKNSYIIASIFVFISAGLILLTYWDIAAGPHMVDSVVTIFSAVSLAGLGLIIFKRNQWMKWVLLLIMAFEILNLVEVIRYRSTIQLILTIIQFVLIFGAMMLLFLIKDNKEQKMEHDPLQIPEA
jgi:hypothetical protein